MFVGLLLAGFGSIIIGRYTLKSVAQRIRLVLVVLTASLLAYNYVVFGLPGTEWLDSYGNVWPSIISTLWGGAFGLAIFFLTENRE